MKRVSTPKAPPRGEMKIATVFRRLLSVLIGAYALSLLVFAATALSSNLTLGVPRAIPAAALPPSVIVANLVVIRPTSLSIPEATLKVAIDVQVTPSFVSEFEDTKTHRPLIRCDSQYQCRGIGDTRHRRLHLVISTLSGDGPHTHNRSSPMGRLLALYSRYRPFQFVIPLRVYQSSAAYPSDQYSVNLNISVSISGANTKSPSKAPFDYVVDGSEISRSFDLESGPSCGDSPVCSLSRNVIYVLIRRKSQEVTLIYLLTLLPGAFGVLVTSLLLRSSRHGARDPEGFVIGIGAALLTIVPLRAVLVPPTIPTASRVDLVLAVEMAVLVAVTVVRYAFDRRPPDDDRETDGESGHLAE